MAEVTIKQLAQVVGTPVEKLLEQLREAGVVKSAESDAVSDEEKYALLQHLRNARGQPAAAPTESTGKKITLRKNRRSALKSDSSGRNTVNVEVRGRRTVVNPADSQEDDAPSDADTANVEDESKLDANADAVESATDSVDDNVSSSQDVAADDVSDVTDSGDAASESDDTANVDANAAAEARIRAEAEAAIAAASAASENGCGSARVC